MRNTTLGQIIDETKGSLKTGPFGTKLSASEYASVGAPVISVGEVGYGKLRVGTKTKRVPSSVMERMPEYLLKPGDIVFGRKGAVDRSAWVAADEEGYFLGSDGIRVRFGVGVDSRFMAYQLQSLRVREWLLQHAVGTTLASLNEPTLRSVPVAMPPLSDQRAIAAMLGALDDKIESNLRAVNIIQGTSSALFAHWRNEAPIAETSTFGAYAEVYGGATPKTKVAEYWGGDLAWTTPTDVTRLEAPYLFETARTITNEGLQNCTATMHPVGTIFMTSRATIGAFAINQVPAATNQGFIAVRPRRGVDRYFLFEEMRSRVDEFLGNANGSTFLEISRGRFKNLPIAIPRTEVLAQLDQRLKPLHFKAA